MSIRRLPSGVEERVHLRVLGEVAFRSLADREKTPRSRSRLRSMLTAGESSLRPRRTVLIVDPSSETREVLRTALEGETTHVLEAHRADRGLEMVRAHRPHLVVLDLEMDESSADDLAENFNAETEPEEATLLMLGSARRVRQRRPGWQFVDKPYHYGPLIRKIEALLEGASDPPLRRCA